MDIAKNLNKTNLTKGKTTGFYIKAVRSTTQLTERHSCLCHYFISCANKAHKKFSSSPLGELTEQQRRIYNELPISFTTGEGVEIAQNCGLGERAFKEWIKSKFFRHISHSKYEKRYK